MQYITTGNRIAVENFTIGDLYTITFTNGNYINSACIGIGGNFVTFQRNEPELLFSLTMETAELVSTIDLYAGGSGTNNYNELTNKPQINSIELVGNKSLAAFGIQPEITEESPLSSALVSGLGSAAAAETSDFATAAQGALAASAVQPATMEAALALKQDALSSAQLAAVDSGITSADVAQITTNKNNISLLIDNSVKNVLCIERDVVYALNSSLSWSGNTCSYNGVNYTFENGVITVNTPTSATATSYLYLSQSIDKYCNGQYILSGHSGNVRIYAAKGNYFKEDDGNGVVLTTTSETGVGSVIRVDSGETVNNLVITPMIRPITTGSTFEKYAPSNRELYEMILAL